jgi:diguanylate cyclase (GGDEF)-like protein
MDKPKVLVVDDNPASLLAMESILVPAAERTGYEVLTAGSGEDALRKVLQHEFAVILLDVNMPRMDGFETAETIRARTRSASIPIIFITADNTDDISRLKGYQSGAVDYLYSPVITEVLVAKVEIFVELAKQRLELKLKTEELDRLNRDLRAQRLHDLERANLALQAEVEERRRAEQRAHDLAIKDALTGLLNRRSLTEHLEHAVAYAARHKSRFALLFLDLDDFKSINDDYGHAAGDALLVQAADRIKHAVREADVVARLGGDEFVVLLKGVATQSEAAVVAQKIAAAIARPCIIDADTMTLSASVGIAIFPQDGAFAQALLKTADDAMYRIKKNRHRSGRSLV